MVVYSFGKVTVIILQFLKIGHQNKCFPENVPKFSVGLYPSNISEQLFLNLQTIPPSCSFAYRNMGEVGEGIANPKD